MCGKVQPHVLCSAPQVSQQMPPAVRVLNAALAHASRSKRLDILKAALADPSTTSTNANSSGDGSSSASSSSSSSPSRSRRRAKERAGAAGGDDVPVVGLEALSAAAIQLVDDMEDQQVGRGEGLGVCGRGVA